MSNTTEYLPNIKFDPNVPVTVTLKFSKGKEINNQYGKSFLWGTDEVDGKQSFFATEALDYKITELGAGEGDKITIVKKMADNKTWFEVEMAQNPAKTVTETETAVSGNNDLKDKMKAIYDTCEKNPDLLDKIWQLFMAETSTKDDDLPF